MSDYISREVAKRLTCQYCAVTDICVDDSECAISASFDAVPAADVRPVARGIWEKQNANLVWNDVGLYAAAYKCNKCGELNIAETNFCPNCGADMRNTEEGE